MLLKRRTRRKAGQTRNAAHIEEGYQQAERGHLIDGTQAQHEIEAMKEKWREGRSPGR
jgi:hypothetical protein